jgi:hypothetical protein
VRGARPVNERQSHSLTRISGSVVAWAIFAAIFRASSLLSNLAARLVKMREPRPEVQFGRGSAQPSKAKMPGWLLGDEREPTRIFILEQSPAST